MPKIYIETERMILRDWKDSDASSFIEMNQDEKVMRYFPKTLSGEESLSSLNTMKEHFEKWDYGFFAVELKSTGEFIGFNGLYHPTFKSHFTPCVEIGWRLVPSVWRQGLASEGAKSILDYARDTIKLSEVYSFTTQSNLPSYKVMEKIGMKHVGNFMHPNLEPDHPMADHVLYKIEL